MPQLIPKAACIQAAGNKPKQIHEYVGRVNSATSDVSVAHMISPGGWVEPGQRPEFTEYTIVLRGTLRVEHELGDAMEVHAGQGIITMPGEWVRYSTPGDDGAEYIAVCTPAFSANRVIRDND
ncbi:MAG: cupin domain-containing protein [Candidatus Hydrogenedentes bacterium]|nr:cupin domain-containing protein [Candidatus Hydrogenedentota bacterium]